MLSSLIHRLRRVGLFAIDTGDGLRADFEGITRFRRLAGHLATRVIKIWALRCARWGALAAPTFFTPNIQSLTLQDMSLTIHTPRRSPGRITIQALMATIKPS